MSDDQLLKKFESILAENNTIILSAVDKKIIASEKRIKKDLTEQIEHVSKDLTQKIDESQEDTISVLSAVINTGYDLHEERLQRVEKELDLPPLKHSH